MKKIILGLFLCFGFTTTIAAEGFSPLTDTVINSTNSPAALNTTLQSTDINNRHGQNIDNRITSSSIIANKVKKQIQTIADSVNSGIDTLDKKIRAMGYSSSQKLSQFQLDTQQVIDDANVKITLLKSDIEQIGSDMTAKIVSLQNDNQAEIANLNKKIDHLQSNVNQLRTYLWLLVAGSVLLFALIIVLFLRVKKISKKD